MDTKENIKNRMYKTAINHLGIKSVEGLDPLIRLMIEALASEIYKLSIDISNIEFRLLERLGQLLTPDILMAPQPAHIILKAQPFEDIAEIGKRDIFYLEDYKADPLNTKRLHFYPVDNCKVVNGSIDAIITRKGYYTISDTLNKDLLFHLNNQSVLPHEVWIGLRLDKSLTSQSNLSFYFDFPEYVNRNELINLLPFTRWSIGGKQLDVVVGNYSEHLTNQPKPGKTFFSKYDLENITNISIKKLYEPHFLTIKNNLANDLNLYTKLPVEIKNASSPQNDSLIQPLLWLKIDFPPNFSSNLLNDIFVTINAFPAVNRQLETLTVKSNKITDIVPLKSKDREFFFSVKSVYDSEDRYYEILPFKDAQNHFSGTYSVRRGGIERMDERDAKEYISDLIDLLRDESVSFSLIGKDYLTENLANIRTQITGMEQKLREIKIEKDLHSYLVIDTDELVENICIEYWITNCEYANKIKIGTSFISASNMYVDHKSVISIGASYGGKSLPKSNNTLDIYKYILTSREQIFTNEDIINHCFSEYGTYFSEVDIKKGVYVSSKPKEGLVRTIDIYVVVNKIFESKDEGMREIEESLLHSLNEKSPDSYNYRVFINK